MTGEIEKDGQVLVIKRVHVDYFLKTGSANHEAAYRVHDMHADYCPVARTLKGSIDISTELHLEDN